MKKAIIFIVIIIGLLYGGYRYFLTVASDQMIDQVASELLTEEVINEIIDDPQVSAVIEKYRGEIQSFQESSIQKEELPFSTKQEATKLLVSKFSFGEIREITTKASRGLTVQEQVELEKKVMDRLTQEELEALLVVGLTEIGY
ncbi:hypothetical protein ACM26V_22965 [Salipaludibacillus sp. HK11]|uniref:hypothetical protein n=1 Tax=Salipaludibacillus sp. HK11 TaxID=3394320 RepID=UPI0039FCD5A6